MSNDIRGDARAEAARVVGRVAEDQHIELSKAQTGILVEAVEQDMITLAEKVDDDEDRLAKLETQTRILSDAVVAITTVDETLAHAVRAVQDEMHGRRRTTDAQPDLPSGGHTTDDRKPDVSAAATLDVGGLTDIARTIRATLDASSRFRAGLFELPLTGPAETPTDDPEDDGRKTSD